MRLPSLYVPFPIKNVSGTTPAAISTPVHSRRISYGVEIYSVLFKIKINFFFFEVPDLEFERKCEMGSVCGS